MWGAVEPMLACPCPKHKGRPRHHKLMTPSHVASCQRHNYIQFPNLERILHHRLGNALVNIPSSSHGEKQGPPDALRTHGAAPQGVQLRRLQPSSEAPVAADPGQRRVLRRKEKRGTRPIGPSMVKAVGSQARENPPILSTYDLLLARTTHSTLKRKQSRTQSLTGSHLPRPT